MLRPVQEGQAVSTGKTLDCALLWMIRCVVAKYSCRAQSAAADAPTDSGCGDLARTAGLARGYRIVSPYN